MLHDNYHVQAHNNAADQVESPALQQIIEHTSKLLKANNEPFRVRTRQFEGSEIVKIIAISTDHLLHFCVLKNRPTNVHVKAMKYRSAYDDTANAGWTSPRTCDFRTDRRGWLDDAPLKNIQELTRDWLFLNETNARTPRETFLAVDGVSEAPSRFKAGTFVIDAIKLRADSSLRIAVGNRSQGCQILLDEEFSRHLNEPMRMRGCRAVIHHDGVVRVLRQQNFRQLYELSGQRLAA